jgi:hypothetical protein
MTTDATMTGDGTWPAPDIMSDEAWQRRQTPPDAPRRYADWEFIHLPSTNRVWAIREAYRMIQECIYNHGVRLYPDDCPFMWDAPCDVILERVELEQMFGLGGIATSGMVPDQVRPFTQTIYGLVELRNRYAHPANPFQSTLQSLCTYVSYARDLASLLQDAAATQDFDDLLGRLETKGHAVLQQLVDCKNNPNIPMWPRHCERTLEYALWFYEDSTQWNRIPTVVRQAAVKYRQRFIAPGKRRDTSDPLFIPVPTTPPTLRRCSQRIADLLQRTG